MATKTGASGIVKVQVSGTTVAVVGEVRSFTFDGSADTIEDSVMGDVARSYKTGLKTNTVSLEVYWDEADAQQLILDERASVDFEVYPTGNGTGETFFSGSGIVTSRSISGAFDGMVEASFTIQCSGAVTEAQV
jgi:predicted secreted protein